jgi:hypothetical protein
MAASHIDGHKAAKYVHRFPLKFFSSIQGTLTAEQSLIESEKLQTEIFLMQSSRIQNSLKIPTESTTLSLTGLYLLVKFLPALRSRASLKPHFGYPSDIATVTRTLGNRRRTRYGYFSVTPCQGRHGRQVENSR